MNDRFKFRTWIGSSMEYSVGVSPCGSFYCQKDPHDTHGLITTLYDEDTPVMQCTGLKDKNGKLIYEGDFIESSYIPAQGEEKQTGIVEWTPYGYRLGQESLARLWRKDDVFEIQIIGNIYENPNLKKER